MPDSLIEFLSPDLEHTDDRGSLIQLVSSGWSQVNVIRSRAGSVRGGHYHESSSELFYVLSGEFDLTLRSASAGQDLHIHEGQMFIIPPLTAHTFTFRAPTTLIALYDHPVTRPDGTIDLIRGDQLPGD